MMIKNGDADKNLDSSRTPKGVKKCFRRSRLMMR
jgi:hypothetical protein